MGAAVCRYFTERGGEVRYLADPRIDGGWRLQGPLAGELLEAVARMEFSTARDLLESHGHERMDMDDILWTDVDVLFPCAVQDVIDADNQHAVKAAVVVEGANNPCSSGGRRALHERGLPVIPDFIANPGGAIAASVEMTSAVTDEENARSRAKVLEAKRTTEALVEKNVIEVLEIADDHQAALVDAASLLALRRVLGS